MTRGNACEKCGAIEIDDRRRGFRIAAAFALLWSIVAFGVYYATGRPLFGFGLGPWVGIVMAVVLFFIPVQGPRWRCKKCNALW